MSDKETMSRGRRIEIIGYVIALCMFPAMFIWAGLVKKIDLDVPNWSVLLVGVGFALTGWAILNYGENLQKSWHAREAKSGAPQINKQTGKVENACARCHDVFENPPETAFGCVFFGVHRGTASTSHGNYMEHRHTYATKGSRKGLVCNACVAKERNAGLIFCSMAIVGWFAVLVPLAMLKVSAIAAIVFIFGAVLIVVMLIQNVFVLDDELRDQILKVEYDGQWTRKEYDQLEKKKS